MGEYNELQREWDTRPFIEMMTIRSSESCPFTHPVLVAFDEWPGLEIKCSCTSDSLFESVIGEACAGERAETSKCKTLPAVPTMYLGIINRYKVCGKRGGKAWRDVTRPVIGANEVVYCPKGTMPCDPDF